MSIASLGSPENPPVGTASESVPVVPPGVGRLALYLLLGFAAGLPFYMFNAVLLLMLARHGVDIVTVGFFAWVALLPTFKFAWAPLLDKYDVTGTLTIHGVAKEVTLPVQFLGFAKDPWGNDRAGFSIDTTINRKDFGIVWNKTLDSGGALLGDEVWVSINLETTKKKETAAN